MKYTCINRTGVAVSAVGLGCVTFGREIDQDTSFRLLDYAMEKGVNLLDTAESYGGGQSKALREHEFAISDTREVSTEQSSSEKIIGRWLKARNVRDQVVICTKVRTKGGGGTVEDITRSLQSSLERLGVDCVDVFMMHTPDTSVPIDEILSELNTCMDKGMTRMLGASNFTAAQMKAALAASGARGWPCMKVVEPPYNLIVRDAEEQLFPLCLEQNIAAFIYSPLCQGLLSGKYTRNTTDIPRGSRFDIKPALGPRYFTDRNFRIIDKLRQQAAVMGVPMVRLAVAWAMTHPSVTSTLIGARTLQHIDNGLEALAMALDPDVRAEMSTWH
ncbi:MAG: aldo/keto reductase [Phycisphaeraceae bacterium]|nr:aldo/keto reductase [Phycisphaeraceae bacterium]